MDNVQKTKQYLDQKYGILPEEKKEEKIEEKKEEEPKTKKKKQ